jgi:serine/threonine protein kinase
VPTDEPPNPPNPLTPGEPTGGAGTPASNGPPPSRERPSRRSDRELIEEAMNQVSPRPEENEAAGLRHGAFAGYDILREIHRGGQGVVYQAMQRATKRKVAIKVIHGGPFTGSQGRARFEREVQILGQLNHPNIVGIHDSGVTSDGSFFYVMDYISGQSLDEVLRESKGSPDIEQTIRLFVKICDAVNAAHLKGVIHRDLKPANVRIDVNGEPVVVDFGLAKVGSGDGSDPAEPGRLMTVTGQFVGSLPWASPEQAIGAPDAIDVRTDVYSLGVILYQMLTGKFPYVVVGNMRDVLDNILKAEPSRPSSVHRRINNEVETIILKCLSKERERRYQSAGELARDLRHYLAGDPIEAKRDSGLYVIGKTLQRYRIPAAVAFIFLLTLVIFAISVAVLYRKAEHRRAEAEAARQQTSAALEAESKERRRADENGRSIFDFATTTAFGAAGQMAQVQGGTQALATLIKGSVERLNKLEPQIKDDPELMRRLATALNRLSEYQSDLYNGRLGEPTEAEALHTRALAIRTKLAAANPDGWRSKFELGLSLFRGAMITQSKRDYVAAQKQMSEAIEMYDRSLGLAAKAPVPPEDAADLLECKRSRLKAMRARCYTFLRIAEDAPRDTVDELAASDARLKEGMEAYDAFEQELDRVAAKPEMAAQAKTLHAIVWDERSKGQVLAADNRRIAAELAFKAGDKTRAAAEFESARTLLAKARELSTSSAAFFRTTQAGDTQGSQHDDDLFVSNHALGETAMQAAAIDDSAADKCGMIEFKDSAKKNHSEALKYFRSALGYAESAKASDPWRLSFSRSVAIASAKVAKEAAELAMWRDASEMAERSLQLRRDLLKYDPVVRHKRDLGSGLLRAARISRQIGDVAGTPAERDSAWARAEVQIGEARKVFEEMREMGHLPPHSGEVRETLREQATLWMHIGQDAASRERAQQASMMYRQAKSNLLEAGESVLPEPGQATLGVLDELMKGQK